MVGLEAEAGRADAVKMAQALQVTAELFAKASSDDKLKADLAASKIDTCCSWLSAVAKRFAASALKELQKRISKVMDCMKTVEGPCAKMPALGEIDEYKKAGVKLVGSLADRTAALEIALKKVQETRESIAKVNLVSFDLATGPCCPETIQQHAQATGQDPLTGGADEQKAGSYAKVGAFHVAAIAAICLVRSDKIKNSNPKAAAKELADIGATLRAKWISLPSAETSLK